MPAPKPEIGLSAEELLPAILANAPIAVFEIDPDGVFTLSLGRGLRHEKPLGKSVFDVHRDNPLMIDSCRRALKGEPLTRTVTVGGLAFETRFAPRLDREGKVTGVLVVATDATSAHNAALAKNEFLSTISHELRTPLSSAAGWAWLLREGRLTPAEAAQALETVCRNLSDLKRLIQEMRDAAHVATGQMTLKVTSCDLGAAVRQAAKSLNGTARAKNHALEIFAPSLKGAADKTRVRQIAWILLSNAVKYSPKGSTIVARLERRGDDAVLSVSDEGPGMPHAPARLPAVDMTPRGRGLGLGLAIARRLAELHGGTLDFADAAGGGTVFSARLPLAPEEPRRKRA